MHEFLFGLYLGVKVLAYRIDVFQHGEDIIKQLSKMVIPI